MYARGRGWGPSHRRPRSRRPAATFPDENRDDRLPSGDRDRFASTTGPAERSEVPEVRAVHRRGDCPKGYREFEPEGCLESISFG